MTIVYEDHDDEAASDIPVRRIKFTINGAKKIAEVETRLLLAHLIRQRAAADRHAYRLRHHQLRRVHRTRGRARGEVLHHARRAGRRA